MLTVFSRKKPADKTISKEASVPRMESELKISPKPIITSNQMLKDLFKLKIDQWFNRIVNDLEQLKESMLKMINDYEIKFDNIEQKVNPAEVEDLKSLIKGNPYRPPKKWWIKTHKRIKKEYPGFDDRKLNKIVGGIWDSYSITSKKRILTLRKKKEG